MPAHHPRKWANLEIPIPTAVPIPTTRSAARAEVVGRVGAPTLSCSFLGGEPGTPGWKFDDRYGDYWRMPIYFIFQASGGNGTYTWGDTQVYANGGFDMLNTGATHFFDQNGYESLPNIIAGA
jgi:hypothetical protein